jgi:hypothetical protein
VGFLDGKGAVGRVNGAPTGRVVGEERIEQILLPRNGVGVEYNFGELRPARVSGYVYEDVNQNGKRDEGEPGFANSTVVLKGKDDRDSDVTRTTSTDEEGHYAFANLRPGTYTLTVITKDGLVAAGANVGSEGGRSDGPAKMTRIVLSSGTQADKYDFAKVKKGAGPAAPAPAPPGGPARGEEASDDQPEVEASDDFFTLAGEHTDLLDLHGGASGMMTLSVLATVAAALAFDQAARRAQAGLDLDGPVAACAAFDVAEKPQALLW